MFFSRRDRRDSRRSEISELSTPRSILLKSYTQEELQEYRQVFKMFDTDGVGSIGTAELGNAMRSLGMVTNQNELQNLIREVDQDGNGEIDFEEFCAAMKRMNKKLTWEDTIRQCFDIFDYTESGAIGEMEFRHILQTYGGITDDSVVAEIFAETDVDANGIIDYNEFSMLVKNYLSDDDIH